MFLDTEKADGRVDRGELLTLFARRGVDRRVVLVIRKMYEDNEVKFTMGGINTGWMRNNIGVRQECVMSPTL